MIDKEVKSGDLININGVYIAIEDGEKPHVLCIQIQHGLKIHLDENYFNELTKNTEIIDNYRLNVRDLGDGMFSVYFKHKDYLQKNRTLNGIYKERVGVNWC